MLTVKMLSSGVLHWHLVMMEMDGHRGWVRGVVDELHREREMSLQREIDDEDERLRMKGG